MIVLTQRNCSGSCIYQLPFFCSMAAQMASKKALDYVYYVLAVSSGPALCILWIARKLAMGCFGRLSIYSSVLLSMGKC